MADLINTFKGNQPELKTALSGLYIGRKFKGNNPYRTLSDVEDRVQAQSMMSQGYSHVANNNMNTRHTVEPWLREKAILSGVRIERQHPIYYSVFQNLEQYKQHTPDGFNAIIHKLDQVDLSGWTFTMDDSFVSAAMEEIVETTIEEGYPSHKLHGLVLTSEELLKFLTEDGFPAPLPAALPQYPDGFPRYIEAQMWTQIPNLICNRDCPVVNFTPLPQEFPPHR